MLAHFAWPLNRRHLKAERRYISHPQARSREKVVSYLERLLRSGLPAVVQAGD